MAIAHTQIEQIRSPIITDLTTQCACMNRVKIDTDWATSAGFMNVLSLSVGAAQPSHGPKASRGSAYAVRRRPDISRISKPSTPTGYEVLAKLDQTRAQDQPS